LLKLGNSHCNKRSVTAQTKQDNLLQSKIMVLNHSNNITNRSTNQMLNKPNKYFRKSDNKGTPATGTNCP
jgi:hypothetical protein